MSTHGSISIKYNSGNIDTIFVGSDAYPTWTGKRLLLYYNTLLKVQELMELGDIEILKQFLVPDVNYPHSLRNPQDNVTVAYGRDGDKEKSQMTKWYNWDDYLKHHRWQEYDYLFDVNIGRWYVSINTYDGKPVFIELLPSDCGMTDGKIEDVPIVYEAKKLTGKRKVIQITTSPTQDEGVCVEIMYALCDDGTIWMRLLTETTEKWVLSKDVPQPGEDVEEFENRV